MFTRRKLNKSGSTSVQVIQKSGLRNVVLKTIGSSFDEKQIESFLIDGAQWIRDKQKLTEFDFMVLIPHLKTFLKIFLRSQLLAQSCYLVKYLMKLVLMKFQMSFSES
jgi:hypothetical protein